VRLLKSALRRDLEWLLNTRRIHQEAPAQHEEVRRSLYHYGLPDISSFSRDSGSERARLLRHVEETIATFEPRLANVRVALATDDTSSRRQVHFVIEAMLRMDPNPEPVVFDTVLEVSSGEYQVKGGAGA
jgi:type VI secretion system protein ImpF